MNAIKSNLIGLITFTLIILELIIGFGTLAVVNIPRAFWPSQSLKKYLSRLSNKIGDATVYGLKIIMRLVHGNSIEIIDDNKFDTRKWYLAMSNHQSFADIFIVLVAANNRLPLLKLFMKRELSWIPFIFLANKTLNMPFVNRHSKAELEKNPDLRFLDYKNTLKACKRFQRSPSTIFSYAEGTRNTKEKHDLQKSPYKNLLTPKIGGIATALSAIPNIDTLVDFSLVYKSEKRGAWAFLKGDLKEVKVMIKQYSIPENLKNKNYSLDDAYRENFKNWIEEIWEKKDSEIESLKF